MKKHRLALLSCLPVAVLLLAPSLVSAAAEAAEISYHPGVDRAGAGELGLEPSAALLTWDLPGGLLVVDRGATGSPIADGRRITPSFFKSEWFLVDARARRLGAESVELTLQRLEKCGVVHLVDGGFALCEIPANRLTAFPAARFECQRIRTDPPPTGWEDYRRQASAAGGTRGGRADPADVAAFLALFDEAAFRLMLQEITGAVPFLHNGSPYTARTRYYSSADKLVVGEYLHDKLVGYGYTVEFDDFTYGGTPCRNLVATKIGVTSPDEYVVVGGHYDSTSEQASTLAPGAEDNGSGSCLVMEIARMAATLEFDRSVQFVLFDAEEVGLVGSQHFVNEAVGTGRVITSAITADMVTYYDNDYGVIIEGETAWESLMTVMQNAVAQHTTLKSRKDYNSWGSDHVPFQQAGIPAFLAIDWNWNGYPHYHRSTDSWANVAATAPIGSEITQACAATLAEVAGVRASYDFRISPNGSFDAEGPSSGPFTPASIAYTVENTGGISIDYTVSKTQGWVTLSSAGGTVAPGASEIVTVSINAGADTLPHGHYGDTVAFVNTTNHEGDTSRAVHLQVGVPVMQVAWNMDVDPGWTTEGLWAWGSPTGGGGQYGNPDPPSGATGAKVYGYNLSGDYENNLSERHLTTSPIDCTQWTEVSVRLQRYLNVEQPTYDHARLAISTNGSAFTTLWENTAEITDSSWNQVSYDISSLADGQPTVYLRWTMGDTDSGWQYSGWNIDDVEIWGLANGATASFRNAGTNPASYTATNLPVLGTTYLAQVDCGGTTGHTFALLAGYGVPLTFTLGAGQTALVDPSGPEFLNFPMASGPVATIHVSIPPDPAYAGAQVFTQAAHFGGPVPFALSNAQDLTIGY